MSKRYGIYLTDRRHAALGPKPMQRILQLIDAEIDRLEANGEPVGELGLVYPDEDGTFLATCCDCGVQFPYAGSAFCNQCLAATSPHYIANGSVHEGP